MSSLETIVEPLSHRHHAEHATRFKHAMHQLEELVGIEVTAIGFVI
jgi:hypothetical protein